MELWGVLGNVCAGILLTRTGIQLPGKNEREPEATERQRKLTNGVTKKAGLKVKGLPETFQAL